MFHFGIQLVSYSGLSVYVDGSQVMEFLVGKVIIELAGHGHSVSQFVFTI